MRNGYQDHAHRIDGSERPARFLPRRATGQEGASALRLERADLGERAGVPLTPIDLTDAAQTEQALALVGGGLRPSSPVRRVFAATPGPRRSLRRSRPSSTSCATRPSTRRRGARRGLRRRRTARAGRFRRPLVGAWLPREKIPLPEPLRVPHPGTRGRARRTGTPRARGRRCRRLHFVLRHPERHEDADEFEQDEGADRAEPDHPKRGQRLPPEQ